MTPLELGRGQDIGSADVQDVVAGVALVGLVRGVVEALDDGQAAVLLAFHALLVKAAQESVVFGQVVLEILGVLAPGRGHQFGENGIRGGHVRDSLVHERL